MSENVLATKGLLCIASFGHGIFYIVTTKVYRWCKGDKTPLCWSQPDRNEDDSPIEGTYRLRKRILFVLMLRGVFEFVGSTLLLVTLKIALDNNMNQGISTSMMALAGLMITLLGRCIYNEKLSCPQFFGMATILTAVIFMGVFQENNTNAEDDSQLAESDQPALSTNTAVTLITVVGTVAALSFSLEAIFIKWLC